MAATVRERKVRLGTQEVMFPSPFLQPLQPCNHCLHDVDSLHREMERKGYLYIKGFHDRAEVLAARLAVLEYINEDQQGVIDRERKLEEGALHPGCGVGCIPFMEGRNRITQSEAVRKVIEGPRPYEFFKKYFRGRDVRTFDYKWLRGVGEGEFTGVHVDNVYMGRGSPELLTMWTPLGDLTVDKGVVAVCEGSHSLPGFTRLQETYGSMDVDDINLSGSGWLTCDPCEIIEKFGGQWKTTDYEAGDVLIFNMRTIHMSSVNLTNYVRISCDTRWQPSEDRADDRFTGDFSPTQKKFGAYSSDDVTTKEHVTMEILKKKWGL